MRRLAVASIVVAGVTLRGAPTLAAERRTGTARAQDAGWQVAGRRDGANVTCETLHRENVPDARLQQIRRVGRVAGDQMQITQNEQSIACRSPRTGMLRRS